MGTIANLITYVGAATGDFHRGMNAVLDTGGQVAAKFAVIGAAAGTALAGVAVAAGKLAADYQDQMGDVSTLIDGGPTEAMERFGGSVKKLSILTGKGLADINTGLYETISAWGDSADAAKQLEIAAKAAVGGKAGTVDAIKLLSTTTKGYGDTSAAAVQKVADLAFMTANLGQTTFPELASEIGETVPLANALGIKVEALFGGFATLTGVTGNTAEVATQLKATFSSLINPSSEMAAKLAKLGFANGKTAIETLGLQGTLDLLAKSTGGNTAQLAKMFGSTEALNAVLALTGAQSKDFTDKTLAMSNAAGAADTAFQKKSSTVNSLIDRLKQMGAVALVELGEKFLPAFTAAGEWLMSNMPAIQAVVEVAFDAVGVAINAVGAVFTWLKDTVLMPFAQAWNGDMTAMQTPIGQFAVVVKGWWESIAGIFTNFRTSIWEPFVQGWNGGNTQMGTILGTTAAVIGSIMKSIWEIIQGAWELIKMVWDTFGDDIMAVVKVVWNTILEVIDGVLKVISGIIKFFVSLFKGDWQGMWDAIKQIWEGLWQIIVAVATGAWDLIKALFNIIVDVLVGAWKIISKAAVDLWNWMWDGIVNGVTAAWNWLKTALTTLWDNIKGWFVGLAEAAIQWGSDLMRGFWDGITGWFSRIWDGIKDFANGVADKVKGALGIHSPSRVFMGIGENIGAGLAIGISASERMVNRSLADLTGGQIDVAMRSVARSDQSAAGGYSGPKEIRIPISIGDQDFGEYVVDLLTGTVRQPKRAMGTA